MRARELSGRQKLDRIALTVKSPRYAFTFDNSYDKRCCPPPDDVYVAAFPNGYEEVEGTTGRGKPISLSGVRGDYRLGDPVPLTAFTDRKDWLAVPEGPELTFGVLTRRSALTRGRNPLLIGSDVTLSMGSLDEIVTSTSKTSLRSMLKSGTAADVVARSKVEVGEHTLVNLSPAARLSIAVPIAAATSGAKYSRAMSMATRGTAKKASVKSAAAKRSTARGSTARGSTARGSTARGSTAKGKHGNAEHSKGEHVGKKVRPTVCRKAPHPAGRCVDAVAAAGAPTLWGSGRPARGCYVRPGCRATVASGRALLAWIHRVGRSVPSGRQRRMTSCAGL